MNQLLPLKKLLSIVSTTKLVLLSISVFQCLRDDFCFSQCVAKQNNLSHDMIEMFKADEAKFEKLFNSCFNKMTKKEHDVSLEPHES